MLVEDLEGQNAEPDQYLIRDASNAQPSPIRRSVRVAIPQDSSQASLDSLKSLMSHDGMATWTLEQQRIKYRELK